jgi:hypothetical protein
MASTTDQLPDSISHAPSELPSPPIKSYKSEVTFKASTADSIDLHRDRDESSGGHQAAVGVTSTSRDSFVPDARDKRIYLVKNLDTGEFVDMRDENAHSFSESFTRVVGSLDMEVDFKEFL